MKKLKEQRQKLQEDLDRRELFEYSKVKMIERRYKQIEELDMIISRMEKLNKI